MPSCAQVVIDWTLDGGKVGHTVWYGKYTPPFNLTVADLDALTNALFQPAAFTTLATFFPTLVGPAHASLRNVDVRDQPRIEGSFGGRAGSSASPALPSEVAAVLTLRTALTGRGNRGRSYIPCWATNALGAGNVISSAAVTALQAWGNLIIPSFAAGRMQFVLGQKHRLEYTSPGGVHHPDRPAFGLPITQVSVRDNHWDTQRRRGLK